MTTADNATTETVVVNMPYEDGRVLSMTLTAGEHKELSAWADAENMSVEQASIYFVRKGVEAVMAEMKRQE